jgi:D-xylose transport system permease protein
MTTHQHDTGQAGASTTAAAVDESAPAGAPALIDANLAASTGEYVRAWWSRLRSGDAGNLPVLAGLVLIVVIFATQSNRFISAENFANLLEQMPYVVLFGMTEVFVLLLGEIDLSAGYNAACGASIILILNGQLHNWPWWASMVAGFAFCALMGLIQGVLITRLSIPSFVVTLAGLLGLEGVLLVILNQFAGKQTGGTVAMNNHILYDIGNGLVTPVAGWILTLALIALFAAYTLVRDGRRRRANLVTPPFGLQLAKIAGVTVIGVAVVVVCNLNRGRITPIRGVPTCVYLLLAIVVITTFVLTRTRFGRYVYAVGGNAEAARRAGIRVNRIRVTCFTLAGLMAGVTGLFYASYTQSMSTAVDGGQLVLYAVAAAVIGGTSLFGGRGKMVHAVLGGLVIATITNGMGLLNIGAAGQYMITALVLLFAAGVDAVARRGRVAA